jgi:GTPase SAR1 family protein
MTKAGLPCMLVASKSDTKQESRQINPLFLEQVKRNLASVAIAEVSLKTPQSIKLCFLNMLNRVITSPRGKSTSVTIFSLRLPCPSFSFLSAPSVPLA